jgi:hypothetical protein
MNSEQLSGSWTHSHEEDQGDILVYRPTGTFAFPPARGRDTLVFGEGGALTEHAPAADDRSQSTGGNWTPLGMNRYRLQGMPNTPSRVIEVIEHTPEVLKIRNV